MTFCENNIWRFSQQFIQWWIQNLGFLQKMKIPCKMRENVLCVLGKKTSWKIFWSFILCLKLFLIKRIFFWLNKKCKKNIFKIEKSKKMIFGIIYAMDAQEWQKIWKIMIKKVYGRNILWIMFSPWKNEFRIKI